MRFFIPLVILATTTSSDLAGAPPAKEKRVVQPALWWSDLGRKSDGSGPTFKATTRLISGAKEFATVWNQLGLKGEVPRVNFKDYLVVVDFRVSGIDFRPTGGLAIDPKGNAKLAGLPAHWIQTNAGWYSTTIGVFPRKGIVSVEGQKLPAAE
jgi:hypothetical protein